MKADEVVVKEHRRQERVYKQMHRLHTGGERILYQSLLRSRMRHFFFKDLVLVRQPYERAHYLIWALDVAGTSLYLIKR